MQRRMAWTHTAETLLLQCRINRGQAVCVRSCPHLATAKNGAQAMRWLCTYGPRAMIMPASSKRFSSPVKGDGKGGLQWFRVFTALQTG